MTRFQIRLHSTLKCFTNVEECVKYIARYSFLDTVFSFQTKYILRIKIRGNVVFLHLEKIYDELKKNET